MKQYSILVVEDNQVNQLLLEQQLRYLGYQVTIINDGVSALERVAEGNIDVILTDIRMPGMDGYELTRNLKSSPDSTIARIPVIAVTANVTAEDERKCIEAGMNDFIAKPIDLNVLDTKLLKWTRNLADSATPVSCVDAINEHQQAVEVDIRPLLDLAQGDRQAVNAILNNFVRQTAILIDDIHKACIQKDNNSVVFGSHKLKSSAGSIGAAQLADISARLEIAAKTGGDWDTIRQIQNDMDTAYQSTKTAIVNEIA